jgi:hypothetical protein
MVEHNYVTSYVGVIGRRLVVLNWPRQKIRTYLKKKLTPKMGEGMAHVGEPNKHKALSLNPSTTKKQGEKERGE